MQQYSEQNAIPSNENEQLSPETKVWLERIKYDHDEINRFLKPKITTNGLSHLVFQLRSFYDDNGVYLDDVHGRLLLSKQEFDSLPINEQLKIQTALSECLTPLLEAVINGWIEHSSTKEVAEMFKGNFYNLSSLVDNWSQPTSSIRSFINNETREKIDSFANTYRSFKEYYSVDRWKKKIEEANTTQSKLEFVKTALDLKIFPHWIAKEELTQIINDNSLQFEDIFSIHTQLMENVPILNILKTRLQTLTPSIMSGNYQTFIADVKRIRLLLETNKNNELMLQLDQEISDYMLSLSLQINDVTSWEAFVVSMFENIDIDTENKINLLPKHTARFGELIEAKLPSFSPAIARSETNDIITYASEFQKSKLFNIDPLFREVFFDKFTKYIKNLIDLTLDFKRGDVVSQLISLRTITLAFPNYFKNEPENLFSEIKILLLQPPTKNSVAKVPFVLADLEKTPDQSESLIRTYSQENSFGSFITEYELFKDKLPNEMQWFKTYRFIPLLKITLHRPHFFEANKQNFLDLFQEMVRNKTYTKQTLSEELQNIQIPGEKIADKKPNILKKVGAFLAKTSTSSNIKAELLAMCDRVFEEES